MITLTTISDLHGYFPSLIGGDILIVAGDCPDWDETQEWKQFFQWLKDQQYTHKILVAGNHDNFLANCCSTAEALKILPEEDREGWDNFTYLCDSFAEIEGLKIYGSPWTLNFTEQNPACKAFGVDTEKELAEHFSKIPEDVDILVTHSPPFGIFDCTYDNKSVGSPSLLKRVKEISPIYHIFGHIHEGGQSSVYLDETMYVNASIFEASFFPVEVKTNFTIKT